MKQIEKNRFSATKINGKATILSAPVLSWEVLTSQDDGAGYRVDLTQFLEGTKPDSPPLVSHKLSRRRVFKPGRAGYLNVAPQPYLIRALAPSIRTWSSSLNLRSVNETLSQLKHFFNFLTKAEPIHSTAPSNQETGKWALTDISPELFQQFAEYLRRLNLSSVRMHGVYNAARSTIERAAGIEYLPSCPFSTLPDNEAGVQYSSRQMKALLDIAKATIRDFKSRRRELLQSEMNDKVRQFIGKRLENGVMNFNRAPNELPSYVAHSIFPCLRVASAFILLALLRSGTNLQPLLDLIPSNWSEPNPFSPKYATVVMNKNRRGRNAKSKTIKIPTQKRPRFYLYRTLRYYDLLVTPLRRPALAHHKRHTGDTIAERGQYISSLRSRFWLHLNNNLEVTQLEENSAIRGINLLISEACAQPSQINQCLLNSESQPIRFSSKAIRDGWFEFILRNSKYNLVAGQIALSHSQESSSIRHYIRHKWARQFADREMRRFHSAAVTVLNEKNVHFGPTTIRIVINEGTDALLLQREHKGRYGAYCRDPAHPPPSIYETDQNSDICPAVSCDNCPYANYFESSLPELIAEIEVLRHSGDEMPPYLWEGSADWERLGRLQELLGRFSEASIKVAREQAQKLQIPDIRFLETISL